jgi:hypothetical protein
VRTGAIAAHSPTALIGLLVAALAVAAMAVDHLMGDDPGPENPRFEDPAAFLLASAISVGLAAVLFGVVLPRWERDTGHERNARRALVLAGLAVVSLPLTLWLGVPFVLGGAAAALGLAAVRHGAGRRAAVAVGLGALIVAVGTVAYAVEAVRKL